MAKQALEIDRLKKENTAAKKASIIQELIALEIDTKDYTKKYTFDQMVAIRDSKLQETANFNTLKKKTDEAGDEVVDLDPGWYDHTPTTGFPRGVWRSSTDDKILKDARNRDLKTETRA